MGVLSPGLIFSGWDSVRAKLIETTEDGGCEFWGAWEGKGKETVLDTGVWTRGMDGTTQPFLNIVGFGAIVDTVDPS